MKLRRMLPLMILGLPLPSFAANELGNGGDAVVCNESQETLRHKSVMLLDYYESDNRFSMPYSLGGEALSVEEKVDLVLDRLAVHDPYRASQYRIRHTEFWNEVNISPNIHLPELNDEGPVTLPAASCEVKQVAYFMEPELPGDKSYFIKEGLWNRLDNDSKAGIVLHEIIYREAAQEGHTLSTRSRYFNALISSHWLENHAREEYSEILDRTVQLQGVYKHMDLTLKLGGLIFDGEGKLESGWLGGTRYDVSTVSTPYNTFELPIMNDDTQARIEFHTNERFKRVSEVRQMWLRTSSYRLCYATGSCVSSRSQCTGMFFEEFELDAYGNISMLKGCEPETIQWLTESGTSITIGDYLVPNMRLEFHPELRWKGGQIGERAETVESAGGDMIYIAPHSEVLFDSRGYVTSGTLWQPMRFLTGVQTHVDLKEGDHFTLDQEGYLID